MSVELRYDDRVEQVAKQINDGRSPLDAEGVKAAPPAVGAIRLHPPVWGSMTQGQAYGLVNRNLPDGLGCESEKLGEQTVEVRIFKQ